ncbi:kinase-like protein [Mytilinidion resinicola]|uniref:Kinase-like protein n=1 Tax=Mytilinidion resinicola TaxID=574789 RepID=A0A6A6Z602_9PEZI|nr:kinase-like protein [Mytilinidion resinicola]KAF2816460.1 kinase-like protein [Mytilinidion resinicola]
MSYLERLSSLRLRNSGPDSPFVAMNNLPFSGGDVMEAFKKLPPHSSHPDFPHLCLLVFEAVLEVVCVALPGYIVARMGMMDLESQKFLANLNTMLFTPCLIFTKLASQLTAEKLVELGVIPFIFVVQCLVSYLSSFAISRLFGFKLRGRNFVTAMAVFGNSNSLPISLVVSLSKTLSGLHWDKIPGDNDDEVAARGILYLLIFQQLGQLVRWTWGYNILLRPASDYTVEEGGTKHVDHLEGSDGNDPEAQALLGSPTESHSDYESGNITPHNRHGYASSYSSSSSGSVDERQNVIPELDPTPTNGNVLPKRPVDYIKRNAILNESSGHMTTFPSPNSTTDLQHIPKGPKGWWIRFKQAITQAFLSVKDGIASTSQKAFSTLPAPFQKVLAKTFSVLFGFLWLIWEGMNPPLWAMLAAIIVASIPKLQHVFFDPGTFISNSVTRAVSQSAGVAVPLILVVLGSNLARNTLPKEDAFSSEDPKEEKKLLIAALVSRMLIPTIIMAPILAVTAKYIPVSILDDPIFVIVCFLLTGAPSALQLSQICQLNNVYLGAMSKLLFQSYNEASSVALHLLVAMASTNDGSPAHDQDAAQSLSQDDPRSSIVDESASPRSSATKVVSIADPESISPMMKGKTTEFEPGSEYSDLDKTAKQFRASVSGKRLSGRPSVDPRRKSSVATLGNEEMDSSSSRPQSHHGHDSLITQIGDWLKLEKARRAARKAKRVAGHRSTPQEAAAGEGSLEEQVGTPGAQEDRRDSDSSDGSDALENLQAILEKSLNLAVQEQRPGYGRKASSVRRIPSVMKISKNTGASSDTDYADGDPVVPSCEAVLDNSKTMAYSGGGAESDEEAGSSMKNAVKEKEAWATFKFEIVRLAHTLRLKGWRKVPLERSNEVEVERLSGALTNAVYVVVPPKNLPSRKDQSAESIPHPRNPPPKLLLRIYGPQVEHLIDREAELQILRRLARKRIGPRLLGTFTNGRFEEFFHAQTLTPKDLRVPDTSKQIAKRMRELHEGIELLPTEREEGPFVWRNWDKWVERCEQVIAWLDKQVKDGESKADDPAAEAIKKRGFICGVEWPVFRQTVEKYRKWLDEQYGGPGKVNDRLVFAHNDTQYGNILRLIPAGESPLLLPKNEHKQLVVIDFEYASANLPGLEFANHFTEWCYNYHDATAPHLCNTKHYPTIEEQHRFIRSYLLHNPTFKGPSAASSQPPTPSLDPGTPSVRPSNPGGTPTASLATAAPSSSISAFMLDSRAPPTSYAESEEKSEKDTEAEIQRLMAETRLWRLANSAQWVAWGIVQAKVPGLPDWDDEGKAKGGEEADASPEGKLLESALLEVKEAAKKEAEEGDKEEEEEEFDYLAYAQDRAWFFWGDVVKLGLVRVEELPEGVREMAKEKMVEY